MFAEEFRGTLSQCQEFVEPWTRSSHVVSHPNYEIKRDGTTMIDGEEAYLVLTDRPSGRTAAEDDHLYETLVIDTQKYSQGFRDGQIGKDKASDDPNYEEGYWDGRASKMSRVAAPVNPYMPENNPFAVDHPAPGTPNEMFDGPPHSTPEPMSVPITTKPRQMPGAAQAPGGTGAADEEPEEGELPSLTGSLLSFHCMRTGQKFASRFDPAMTCVCGRDDYDLDLEPAIHTGMEGDPPWGMVDEFFPDMDLIETSEQFGVPFQEEGPEGLEDQPFNQEQEEAKKVEAITRDIMISNPGLTTAKARRVASLTVKKYPTIRTADIAPTEAGVKVGDIFYSSWGYDQTNTDFYEVVGLKPASVVIRKVRSRNVATEGNPHDSLVPVPGAYIDDRDIPGPTVKRLLGSPGHLYLKIDPRGVVYAWPWDGTPKYQTGWAYGH